MTRLGHPHVEKLEAAGDVKGLVRALLYRRDTHVREAASQALLDLGAPAVPPLIAALRGRLYPRHLEENTREAIVGTLARIRWPAVDPLIVTLVDTAAALNKLNRVLRGRPFARMLDRYRGLFRAVCSALGQIGTRRAIEPLAAVLVHADEDVRRDALAALQMLDTPAVVSALVNVLQDQERTGRWVAAWALGAVGDVQAVQPLIAALNDEDREVRGAAAAALAQIGDARAVSSLYMALRRWQQDRHVLIRALEQIVDTRSVNALISALNDDDLRVRLDAAKALVRMYRSGSLNEADMQAIRAQRETLARIERQVRENSPH